MNHILSGKQFADKIILNKIFSKAAKLEQADKAGKMPKPMAGKIDGLKIAFLADMRYQRNIHSLCQIFPAFKNIKLYLIGPKELALPDEYKKVLKDGGVEFEEREKLDDVISDIDVLYIARVFK